MSRRPRQPYDDIVVAAPVTVPYRALSRNESGPLVDRPCACTSLVDAAAGLRPTDIDGLALSSFTLFPDTGGRPDAASRAWFRAGSTTVLASAAPAPASPCAAPRGRWRRETRRSSPAWRATPTGVDSFRTLLNGFSRFAQDAVNPYGFGGPNGVFALLTDHYMRELRRHAGGFRAHLHRPARQRDELPARPDEAKPLTHGRIHEAARPVAEPIALFDCVMPCAGAEAFLVTSRDVADELGLASARLLATIERHNAYPDDAIQSQRAAGTMDVDELYAMAAIVAGRDRRAWRPTTTTRSSS